MSEMCCPVVIFLSAIPDRSCAIVELPDASPGGPWLFRIVLAFARFGGANLAPAVANLALSDGTDSSLQSTRTQPTQPQHHS